LVNLFELYDDARTCQRHVYLFKPAFEIVLGIEISSEQFSRFVRNVCSENLFRSYVLFYDTARSSDYKWSFVYAI